MSSIHVRAKELFLDALDRPPSERGRFVIEQCGEDAALLAEVQSLLAFHEDDLQSADPDADASTPAELPPAAREWSAGDVLAGRYRMVARIGRGGMGDVWRADDLVVKTPVALKLIHAVGADGRRPIIHEVRLARQITHPAVCRVFDVGDDQGQVFLSMELVEGEDLSALLKHAGRLSSEKVVEIAHQLCDGLAAAHARGVLHRDLKPANVLVDADGRVKITDFGIAVTRRETTRHVLVGTPAYMAPEQLKPGTTLSECTDIYALGLILYELLTGQHPFDRVPGARTLPPAPSSQVPHVDPGLEQAILRALQPHAADRPASAAAMAAMLPTGSGGPVRRGSWAWSAAAVVAGLSLVAAIAYSFILPRSVRGLTAQDRIVLADFANATGETVFDGTLEVALAVALEQSPFLRVFPDDRVRETLRLMGRPADTRVTAAVAREVAQREQLKALVSGSIATLGSHFVLTVEAINADTGDVMAREQVEVASREMVLTSLGTAVSRLREKLGESLASVQRFDVPLARATTPSLDALHAYSMALDEGRLNLRLESVPHLQRALELDPDFALALAQTAAVYSNNGQTALGAEFARRAFDLRDRVSERERFVVGFRYYRDAAQDWTQALELARLWTDTYPREAFAFNSLATTYINLGQPEEAIRALRRAIELDPKFSAAYGNLAAVLMTMNRVDDATAVLDDAAGRQLESATTRRIRYLLAFLEGDRETAVRQYTASIGLGQTNAAYAWEARSEAFAGRIGSAHDLFRRGLQLATQDGFREVASQLALGDAEIHAIVRQCDLARTETAEALELGRDNFAMERASRIYALCGQPAQAAALVTELTTRFPTATLTQRIAIPMTRAAAALERGDAAQALTILEALRLYDHAPKSEYWIPYLRGLAHLRVGNGAGAIDDFTAVLDRRGENPNSPLYPLSRLGLARAAALTGAVDQARRAYGEFLRVWRDADHDLPLLQEARQELARLS